MAQLKGVFPKQEIISNIGSGMIKSPDPEATKANAQPATLDLGLGKRVWRMEGSLLPGKDEPVEALIEKFGNVEIDIEQPTILDRGIVYIAELRESLELFPEVSAYANSKSSTGRNGLRTQLLTDFNHRYDLVSKGYKGKLFLQLIPQAFSVAVQEGLSLNQIRFYAGEPLDARLDSIELRTAHGKTPLLYDQNKIAISSIDDLLLEDGVLMTVDLEGEPPAWRARPTGKVFDFTQPKGTYNPLDFWEPIPLSGDGTITLSDGGFYLLSTNEYISIPPNLSAEMIAYDPQTGEFRSHDAGLFEGGFGYNGKGGTRIYGTPATLEASVQRGGSLILRPRRPVCKMIFERMRQIPDQLYEGNYNEQRGPTPSKHYKPVKDLRQKLLVA